MLAPGLLSTTVDSLVEEEALLGTDLVGSIGVRFTVAVAGADFLTGASGSLKMAATFCGICSFHAATPKTDNAMTAIALSIIFGVAIRPTSARVGLNCCVGTG